MTAEALRLGADGVLRSTGQTPGVVMGVGPQGTLRVNPGGDKVVLIDRDDAIAGAVDASALVALAGRVIVEWQQSWSVLARRNPRVAQTATEEATACVRQVYGRLGSDFTSAEIADAYTTMTLDGFDAVMRAERVVDLIREIDDALSSLDDRPRRRWWRR